MGVGCIIFLVLGVVLIIILTSIGVPLKIAVIISGVLILLSFIKWVMNPTTWLMGIHNELEQARYDREQERYDREIQNLSEFDAGYIDQEEKHTTTVTYYNIDARSVHYHSSKKSAKNNDVNKKSRQNNLINNKKSSIKKYNNEDRNRLSSDKIICQNCNAIMNRSDRNCPNCYEKNEYYGIHI